MIYASSAATIKASLGTDSFVALQVTEPADLAHDELIKALTLKYNC